MSKLYSESEVRKLLNEILTLSSSVDDAISTLTPIELPTDEEITKGAEWLDNPLERIGFKEGAKWMRDKIKKGGE